MSWLDDIIDPARVNTHIDQGSEAWEEIRLGRFTSSEWHKLMDYGKRPMTEAELKARPKTGKGSKTTTVPDLTTFSEKGHTYIRMKVAEVLTGQKQEDAYAYPLVYGKTMEPEGVLHYETKYGCVTETVGFQPFGDHAGGSPDRVILGTKIGLEIKCPQTIDKQVDYLYLTDRQSLKDMHPDYYWQCVTLMFFMDYEEWHFRTYDPRYVQDKHKMAGVDILRVEVEEEFDLIAKVLENAVREKLMILQTLNA